MEDYQKILSNVKYTPEKRSLGTKPISCNNSHVLKCIGGSCNGRKDGDYGLVYRCLNCERFGYLEDFENNFKNR